MTKRSSVAPEKSRRTTTPVKKRNTTSEKTDRQTESTRSAEQRLLHEPTLPLMLRPKISQKACAEQIAEQIGMKRSQLDPVFYLTGALLVGIERLSKEEMIGTWTRKQVAVYLKNAFAPLFELLYEQDELPLVFSLLIGRGAAPVSSQPVQSEPLSSSSTITRPIPQTPPEPVKETYDFALSTDAEIGLDGFPSGL